MAALDLGFTIDQIYQYLIYNGQWQLEDLIGGGGDRDDTLEYLRWYPDMWSASQKHQYDAFCLIYGGNQAD